MPCYDPPPPWEGEYRKSAEEAVRLLCGMVGACLDAGEPVPSEALAWFIGHRNIDYAAATSPSWATANPAEAAMAMDDVTRAQVAMGRTSANG